MYKIAALNINEDGVIFLDNWETDESSTGSSVTSDDEIFVIDDIYK